VVKFVLVSASRIGCIGVTVLTALLLAATASAHLRSGTLAVDYRARVIGPRFPTGAPFTVRIYSSDRALRLSVRAGHTVTVLGYLGEPFVRIDGAGVAINDASPTAAGAGLVKNGRPVSGSSPVWALQPGRNVVVWHDRRVQALPPGVSHVAWSLPVLLDGHRTNIRGETWRLGRPALWPWLTLVLVFLAVSALLALPKHARRRRTAGIVFGSIAGTAAVAAATGFAIDPYASPGTWIAEFDELAFVAVGFGFLIWGAPKTHVAAAIWLGLIALAVGFSEAPIFLHALVLSTFSGFAARLLATAAIGAGLAATTLGGLLYLTTARLESSSR
jgi:hypothetical protein